MNKRRSTPDDEIEGEEYEDETEQTVVEAAPPRRLRPRELMFSTTGRLALGALGVLILLGGAAVVNQLINRKPAVVAKKPDAKAKADAAQSTTTEPGAEPAAEEETDPVATAPAYSAKEERYAPTNPEDFEYQAPQPTESPDAFKAFDDAAQPGTETDVEVVETLETEELLEEAPDPPATAEIQPVTDERPAPAQAPPVTAPNPLRNAGRATPLQPTREYVVQEGESLFDIARYELKDPARWIEIYELNAKTLGDQTTLLTGGAKLRLPQR
jgi:nucleoid-associated protein YgaU